MQKPNTYKLHALGFCMYGSNISEGYVHIMETVYTNAAATIHLENEVSKPIHINIGVRHVDTKSPKMFTASIKEEMTADDLCL